MTLADIRSIKDVSDWEGATAAYYESAYNMMRMMPLMIMLLRLLVVLPMVVL